MTKHKPLSKDQVLVVFFPGPAEIGAVLPAAITTVDRFRERLPKLTTLRLPLHTPPRRNQHPFSHHVEDRGEDAATEDTLVLAHTPVSTTCIPLPLTPVGGRLMFFTHAWSAITADTWILNTVTGFHIELLSPPNLGVIPPPIRFAENNVALIDNELRELISKHAVTEVDPFSPGFISNLFLVKNKGGGYRPVINLRELNQYVTYRHFKMEGIHCLRDLLQPVDWLVKVDLKDAYLTVPMHRDSQHLLRFLWWGRTWQFTCLPFGLSSAPWCFTKILKPAMASLRSRGVRLIVYLDDILILAYSKDQAYRHSAWTINLLQGLGFLINQEKSVLIPTQEIEFLGFLVNTNQAVLRLPSAKLALIRKEIRSSTPQGVLISTHTSLSGRSTGGLQAIFPAPLHYRALQRLKNYALTTGSPLRRRDTSLRKPKSNYDGGSGTPSSGMAGLSSIHTQTSS